MAVTQIFSFLANRQRAPEEEKEKENEEEEEAFRLEEVSLLWQSSRSQQNLPLAAGLSDEERWFQHKTEGNGGRSR